ncbi:MAG TPA: bifunctional 4-hydroxy-2-oxoglutarate aldolase/2-dehydro-3-deoxy-phosphogluconate aldolase [Puia sp.]
MPDSSFSWDLFHKMPLVGIIRNVSPLKIKDIASVFAAAGFTSLEITMNSEDTPAVISSLVREFGDRLNIGAGTVCTREDLETALSAGATFIVTPILDEIVIKESVAKDIPIFPGAYTPTEIYKAWSLGASLVKLFPATQLGPNYIKEILAPLPHIKLLPTGGIDLNNFPSWLAAGAKGLGIGSSLFPKDLIDNDRWPALHQHFTDYISKYQKTIPCP